MKYQSSCSIPFLLFFRLLGYSNGAQDDRFGVESRPTTELPQTTTRTRTNTLVDERVGVYRILAIRVTSTFGHEPEESLEEIEEAIFTSEHSVAKQFAAVSHHQLIYEPARTTGVVQVELDRVLGPYDEIEDEIVHVVEQVMGVQSILDIADRILFCFPNGSLNDGIWGLAQFPGRVSALILMATCASPTHFREATTTNVDAQFLV